jgi:hypothetical protein
VTRSYRHNGFGPFCLYPEGAVLVPHLHHKSNEYAKKYVQCHAPPLGNNGVAATA